jgi:NAD(P)H-dependent FMN reductase
MLILSGTHRPDSNALKVSRVLQGHYAAAGVHAEVLSLAELPPEAFLPTVYATKPPAVVAMQERVLAASGIHVVTPEYNGSFPGVLKHFVDLLKFPESFERKPVAFTGEAAGIWGGLRAVEQLQMIFGYRNAHVYPERVFISGVFNKFGPDGKLTDAEIDKRLAEQAKGFAAFAGLLARK